MPALRLGSIYLPFGKFDITSLSVGIDMRKYREGFFSITDYTILNVIFLPAGAVKERIPSLSFTVKTLS